MPQKIPRTSYTGRPVRRLRLPKIGPVKTKSLFEEHFYALLAVTFVVVAILGKAGGLSLYNALLVGGWLTACLWFAGQWRGYLGEKSKATDGKNAAPQVEQRVEAPKGPWSLPPAMKPMIGPQWPVKTLPWPARPSRAKQNPAPAASLPPARKSSAPPPGTLHGPKKRGFVYERPTLPDRKPKLPHNWPKPNDKKPKT